MKVSNAVGVCLKDDLERALLVVASRASGLEPVELPCAALFAGNGNAEEAKRKFPRLRFLIRDRESGASGQPDRESIWKQDLPPVVLVRDALTEPAEEEDSAVAWVLERPLTFDSVAALLRQAARASLAFARQNEAVLASLRLTHSVMESMSNAVAIADASSPDLPLIYVNPAFERITGYTPEEVLGKNCRFLQGDDVGQMELERIRLAIRDRSSTQVLLRNRRKDGVPFWNELHMSPVFDTEGRLTHFAGFQNDVTERVEIQLRLERLSSRDSLTGLPNRASMMEHLKRALSRGRRNQTLVAVLFFDLDNFKAVNDAFGHSTGDAVLRAVAERIKGGTRGCEIASRLGGDEFVVVLEDIPAEDKAVIGMRRLAECIDKPFPIEDRQFHLSASAGMALFPRDGDSPADLLSVADQNLDRAKEQRRRLHRNPGAEPGQEEEHAVELPPVRA